MTNENKSDFKSYYPHINVTDYLSESGKKCFMTVWFVNTNMQKLLDAKRLSSIVNCGFRLVPTSA